MASKTIRQHGEEVFASDGECIDDDDDIIFKKSTISNLKSRRFGAASHRQIWLTK